jgi:hypothetical protein
MLRSQTLGRTIADLESDQFFRDCVGDTDAFNWCRPPTQLVDEDEGIRRSQPCRW